MATMDSHEWRWSMRVCGGWSLLAVILLFLCAVNVSALDMGSPERPLRLVFIHHSCGENWLADGHGGLGKALAKNNYYVSDTNYGWGPDGIGDRTDITDWPVWFTGPQSPRYLRALYRESGQHASYSRSLENPGGENRVILFKSCFPNSALKGRPNDPPRRGHGLTVSNAKAIYNDLLGFFATRPDKLFVAITAPPLQESTHAANARAFNNWLVNDWLEGYKGRNVAVFDFYNVLTGPNNHHQVGYGGIEHVIRGRQNTLYYPTNGDTHPSPSGNRKATNDFVPLLNAYVNHWLAGDPPDSPPLAPEETTAAVSRETGETGAAPARPARQEPAPGAPEGPGLIDGFEGDASAWAAFVDHAQGSSLAFEPDSKVVFNGKASLRIDYRVKPESWALCSLVYDAGRDWTAAGGLRVHIRTEEAGMPVNVVAYQGTSPDALGHFEFRVTSTGGEWQRVDIPWEQLAKPAWEGDPDTPFDPTKALGVAFAFEEGEGTIWVDDVSLMKAGD